MVMESSSSHRRDVVLLLLPLSYRQIEEAISIVDCFPPNRGVDILNFFPPNRESMLPISSRQIENRERRNGGKELARNGGESLSWMNSSLFECPCMVSKMIASVNSQSVSFTSFEYNRYYCAISQQLDME